MTISAPAGYGKSALLANWIDRRRDSGDFVAYHFFSTSDDDVEKADIQLPLPPVRINSTFITK